MEQQLTVGLEIHAELKTRTKMFCDSLNDPDEHHPNVNVCPVCMGHPGTLPVINKKAVESVIRIGLALGGEIAPKTKFDRKNYFYPDLPKGYQISQFDVPMVSKALLEIEVEVESPDAQGSGLRLERRKKIIRIRRVHLEEDAASSAHDTASGATLIDYNRAGMPLMELVTEPDIRSPEEAVAFAKELQLILRALGVSDANMDKGQMRVEANTSVSMGTRTEVKNLNSFRSVGDAIRYEFDRQKTILDKGERIKQETRGWDETARKTVSQRSKEEAHDYRYFPEPDLPSFDLSAFDFEALRASIPELPAGKRIRFEKEYGLNEKQIELLIAEPKISDYFEEMQSEILALCNLPTENPSYKTIGDYPNLKKDMMGRAYTYLVNDLEGFMNSSGVIREEGYAKVTPERLAHFSFVVALGPPDLNENDKLGKANTNEVLQQMFSEQLPIEEIITRRGLTSRQAKDILAKILETGEDPEDIVKDLGFNEKVESGDLEDMIMKVIEENPNAVSDYKKGKAASLQFLLGKTMAAAYGKANPEEIHKILIAKLIRD